MNNLNKIPIHDSSLRHSTGQAIYIDDMPEQENLLHGAPLLSKDACDIIRLLYLLRRINSPVIASKNLYRIDLDSEEQGEGEGGEHHQQGHEGQ